MRSIPTLSDSQSHVLIVGNDAALLETRNWILAKAGFKVDWTTSVGEVERKVAEHRPKVLVLCYTLATEECERVQEIARRRRPSAKTVLLSMHISGCSAQTGDTGVIISPDPLSLIRTVQQLARESGHNENTMATQ